MFLPIGLMNFARGLRNFRDHQEKMPPHLPGDFSPLISRHIRKRGAQILFHDAASQSKYVREERREDTCGFIAKIDWQRLQHGYKCPHQQINDVVKCLLHAADYCTAAELSE